MTQERYATKSQYDRLAKRVDSLDDELKLLKAQIQATLLTIQECILNSKFPALRDGVEPRMNAGRQWNVKKFGIGQVKSVSGVYSADDGFEPDAIPPFDPPILEDSDPYSDLPNFLAVDDDDYGASPGELWQPIPPHASPSVQQVSAAPGRSGWQSDANPQFSNDTPPYGATQNPGISLPAERYNEPNPYSTSHNRVGQPTPVMRQEPAAPAQPAPLVRESHGNDRTEAPQSLSFDVWRDLDRWASEKIREVGIVGTLELAHLCGGEQRETLIKIIAIYEARATELPGATPAITPLTPLPAEKAPPPPVNPEAARAKNAVYRPFGEHQELALQLLEQVLRSRESAMPTTNGNGNVRH